MYNETCHIRWRYIIEDKVGLKQNSLFGTDAVQIQDTIEGFCNKIRTGKNAQVSDDFMIIARIESLIAGKSIDDALARAAAYVEAGADGIMIHSKNKSGDDIKEFCQRFRVANVSIYANHMLRSAYPSMVNCAKSILMHERSQEAVNDYCMPIKEILELIPGTKKTLK